MAATLSRRMLLGWETKLCRLISDLLDPLHYSVNNVFVVVISSLKIPKAFLICSAAQ